MGLEPAQPILPPEEPSAVDAEETPQQEDDQGLEQALKDLFESEDPAVRMEALLELAKIDDEIVWQALIYLALRMKTTGFETQQLRRCRLNGTWTCGFRSFWSIGKRL